METVINDETAYFKSHKKLYTAPVINDGNTIDFEKAERVDYFFLTQEEFEKAMMVLDIFDEREANEIREK